MSPEKAQQEAQKATIEEYRDNGKYEVTPNGYEAFDLKNGADTAGVKAARQQRDQIEKAAVTCSRISRQRCI